MQTNITQSDLTDLGIDIADQDTTDLLNDLNEELDVRIGKEITEALDDNQLDEMLTIQQTGTPEQLANWIAQAISPEELAEITQDERDILLGELAKSNLGTK